MVFEQVLRIQKRSERNLMKKLIIFALLLSSSAFANLHLAPPDFNYFEERVIFVDFKTAEYNITYDMNQKKTFVKSKIFFESTKLGMPLFDLVPNPNHVYIDGDEVASDVIKTPDGAPVRILRAAVMEGTHVLEVEHELKTNVKYKLFGAGVNSAFWFLDLTGRKFMEQYVPSNFEYDQYQMTMNVTFSNLGSKKQDIYTNGEVTEVKPNVYRIVFPEYFTPSCPYFHTTPKGKFRRYDFSYKSISGRDIPMTVYAPFYLFPKKMMTKSLKVMAELEADYGPWAHPGFVAYGTFPGTGGMEHSGAAQTSLGALDHEMLHSYFAKGVMPANGNTGWIDEAIASWRDHGYQRLPLPGYESAGLANHSPYQRYTDDRSYEYGREFLGFLDYKLQNVGGLKAFLKGYFAAYKHTVITTEHFKNNLEFFSGINFTDEFNNYIWGKDVPEDLYRKAAKRNPVHYPVSKRTLESML
jgi:hypothetical protein